jgi:hypothetical protein
LAGGEHASRRQPRGRGETEALGQGAHHPRKKMHIGARSNASICSLFAFLATPCTSKVRPGFCEIRHRREVQTGAKLAQG